MGTSSIIVHLDKFEYRLDWDSFLLQLTNLQRRKQQQKSNNTSK